MSTIKLFILGFLLKGPMSPYELAKLIGDNDVSEMIKVSKPAVYKNFIRLEEEGYLTSRKVRESEMPEKTLYSITDKGRIGFNQMMEQYAGEEVRFHFDFNVMAINLDKVTPQKAEELLNELQRKLTEKEHALAWYVQRYSFLPFEARMIIKQHHMLTETLLRWLVDFRTQYLVEHGQNADDRGGEDND